MEEALIETWGIHNRINLYLMEAIPAGAFADAPAARGRTVGEQLAHLHNARLMWLKVAAPELMKGLAKVEKGDAGRPDRVGAALAGSGRAVEGLLRKAARDGGRVKGFKPHVTAFLGYLIAHEAHHRGQIALALKQAGHALDKKTAYGIWEWGAR